MNNEQLWQAVLGEMELSLSRANFTTWFKSTFISSFEDGKMIICVPNMFTKTWLEKKYHKEIASALKNVTNGEIKEIFYKIEMRKIDPVNIPLNKTKTEYSNAQENNINNNNNVKPVVINRFGLNAKYTFNNFIVGKGNELAHAACQAVAANPGNAYNPLFVYGGVGLGKTHLLQAIGHELSKKTDKILYVSCEKFTNEYIQAVRSGKAKDFKDVYRNVDSLIVDDIHFMGGKDGTQEEFFHTFNELHQANKQIIISSDRPPQAIPALEKRLLSRFQWGMIADIVVPNYETKLAILKAKCYEKNYNLEENILNYIANNIQTNIRELEGALNRLIAYYEFNNSTPTIESTKEILNNIVSTFQEKTISPKIIIEAASKYYDINIKDLIGKSRKKELVVPRQIVMYLIRDEIGTSFPTIGQELGGRDHTTAMHACNKIKKEIKENERIKQNIDSIRQLINHPC